MNRSKSRFLILYTISSLAVMLISNRNICVSLAHWLIVLTRRTQFTLIHLHVRNLNISYDHNSTLHAVDSSNKQGAVIECSRRDFNSTTNSLLIYNKFILIKCLFKLNSLFKILSIELSEVAHESLAVIVRREVIFF